MVIAASQSNCRRSNKQALPRVDAHGIDPALLEPLVAIVRGHAHAYRCFIARIAPVPPPEAAAVYERYLFALLSRHCALSRTVRAFELLRGRYQTEPDALAAVLRDERIGYYNTWAPQIAAFTRAYCAAPERYLPAPDEPFSDARDRIAAATHGLGPAKTAFALGLVLPFDATVCCVDVHIARLLAPLMECPEAAVTRRYREVDALLAEVAACAGVPLAVAHWILWDHQRHGRIDTAGSESVRLIGPLFQQRGLLHLTCEEDTVSTCAPESSISRK
jgi:endonuclease III